MNTADPSSSRESCLLAHRVSIPASRPPFITATASADARTIGLIQIPFPRPGALRPRRFDLRSHEVEDRRHEDQAYQPGPLWPSGS